MVAPTGVNYNLKLPAKPQFINFSNSLEIIADLMYNVRDKKKKRFKIWIALKAMNM